MVESWGHTMTIGGKSNAYIRRLLTASDLAHSQRYGEISRILLNDNEHSDIIARYKEFDSTCLLSLM